MKPLLTSFAAYDLWANEKLLNAILRLDPERQQQEITSSFPSLHKTCVHMWDASSIWWQRLHMHEQIVVPSLSFHPSMPDTANGLLQQNEQWKEWMANTTETDLNRILPYRNIKGDAFQQPVKEILLHLFNHGTYHRGQLVTLLRQVGAEEIPRTDYIEFSRL